MGDSYTERLKEFIGEPEDGRTDYFNLTAKECIEKTKESLKNNFSCSIWTFELSNEEISEFDNLLKKEGIVHIFDEVMDCIVCFNSHEDLMHFYTRLRNEMPEKDLQNLRDLKYNTPIIRLFE